MIKTFNKHQRWLMIVIAVLAVPFIFYFNKTDMGARRASYGKLYGRDLSNVEVDRGERMFDLAYDLGMVDLLRALAGNGQTRDDVKRQFALNLLILQHEAEALGIQPTPDDAIKALSNLRVFRSENGFDMKKYSDAVQNYLGPRGFSEAQLDELAADQVILDRIKDLLGAGINISDAESQKNFQELYGKVDASVIRFHNADVANEVKISDEDVSKYFEGHKADLQSEEKRKVQVISLVLSEAEKKLAGRERVDALQKLADKANDLEQELGKKSADFGAIAAKSQLPVITTADFTRTTPDPQLKDPSVVQAAFQLSNEDPTSEAIQGADGFYILHLAGVTPPRSLTLDEAKPKIAETLKTTRERELLTSRAAKIVQDLREALKQGMPLPAATQKAGGKIEKIPAFALIDEIDPKEPKPETAPDLQMIKRATARLGPNEVTEPIPTRDGLFVAVVEKRNAPEASQAPQRLTLQERLLEQRRGVSFFEWLRQRRRLAGIVERPEPVAS